MTDSIVGVLLGNAALGAGGVGFLLLADGWRHLGRWSRFAVAVLTGQALFLTAAPILLYVGLSVSPAIVLPLVAALALCGLVVSARRGGAPGRAHTGDRTTGAVAAAIVAVPLFVLAWASSLKPLYEVDTMLNWVMKAKIIWGDGSGLTGGLDPRIFARPDLHPQSHLEYPLGFSSLLAWAFHSMDSADIRVMHLQLVLLVAAAVGTSWALLRPLVPDLPLAVGLAGLVMMPAVVQHLLTAYADVPLAFIWATGAVALIRWAGGGERYLLALATLLFAATLAMKQDGAFYDIAIYAGVGLALVFRDRRRILELGASAGIVALTAVPWQLYVASNDLARKDIRPGLLRMQAQADYLVPTAEGIASALSHPRTTFLAVPLAVALALACILRGRSEVAAPFLLACALVLGAILLIYWNSAVTLEAVLIPALGRILMGLIVLAWLLVPLLAFTALSPRRDDLPIPAGDDD